MTSGTTDLTEPSAIAAKVLRGIAARERKRAIAERRDAAAAHKAATTPAPSTVGWSTKAPPKRKPTAADARIAALSENARADWLRRHRGGAAAAERSLRKSRREVHDAWDHKANGTAETHEHAMRAAQTREGSLARLWQAGGIDSEQLAASVEIATVHARIGADVAIRTASFETRLDTPLFGDGGFHEGLMRVRHEVAYTRWRAAVARMPGAPIAVVMEMIVGDSCGHDAAGFTVVARRYRMGNRRAKRLLLDALDLWPEILGGVRKEIDPATLAAAHAGILG